MKLRNELTGKTKEVVLVFTEGEIDEARCRILNFKPAT